METIYTVKRHNKTKSTHIGDFDTVDDAKYAMLEHYRKTPKRGKFYYTIAQEGKEIIGGVVYRTFDMSMKFDRYTQEMLCKMV